MKVKDIVSICKNEIKIIDKLTLVEYTNIDEAMECEIKEIKIDVWNIKAIDLFIDTKNWKKLNGKGD